MPHAPFDCPSKLETLLFAAGKVRKVSLPEIYDIKARTSIQRTWQDPKVCRTLPKVTEPEHWNDKLHACVRGEFFVQALKGCGKILDVGCGEGWPSLYLARSFPAVVGIDLSPEHIALARSTAELMRLSGIEFEIGLIEDLRFGDEEFDGVCFGGNVFTYGVSAEVMLRQVHRVLKPKGVFAFEQWPTDPSQPHFEQIGWFIDGGPPILHYSAGHGLYSRTYFIYIDPQTNQGRRLSELATRMDGELTAEQRKSCEEIKRDLEQGELGIVVEAIYAGVDRSLSAEELPRSPHEAGFADVTSWALPDARQFARSLEADGSLSKLPQDDVLPFIRALVSSAPRCPGWVHQWVTCRKV